MTYTRPWNVATPLGSVLQAPDIDKEFREEKVDLTERMESVLISSMTADPWVVKDEVNGKNNAKRLPIDCTNIKFISGTQSYTDDHVDILTASVGYAHILLPFGCSIAGYDSLHNRNGSTGNIMSLLAVAVATGVASILNTLALGGGAYGIFNSVFAHTVLASNLYKFKYTFAAGMDYYGTIINYGVTDSRYAL